MAKENVVPFHDPKRTKGNTSRNLPATPGLTVKQELFCQAMALDGDLNIKAAATKAGYSAYYAKNRAYTLLEHAKIRARIQEIQADAFKKAGLSPQEILRRIARIADTAEGEDDFPAALRALEMLGKHFALFTDKHVHENREDSFKTGTTPEDRKRDVSNLLRVVPTDRLKQIAKEKND